MEQWTQAEAVWKAGTELGRPTPSSIPIPPDAITGSWALSNDNSYWVMSEKEDGLAWSVAIAREAGGSSDK